MHELGLAEAILAVTLDVSGGDAVRRVTVEVGTHQAVDADSLAFGFEVAAAGTPAAGALLVVRPRAGDRVLVEEVECAGVTPRVIRRPDLEVLEGEHEHEHEHQHQHEQEGQQGPVHPAWL